MVWIAQAVDAVEGFAQRAQTAAVVRTEDDVFLAHLVHQERQCGGIGAGAVDQEMFEKDFRIFFLALRAFMLPEKPVQQKR